MTLIASIISTKSLLAKTVSTRTLRLTTTNTASGLSPLSLCFKSTVAVATATKLQPQEQEQFWIMNDNTTKKSNSAASSSTTQHANHDIEELHKIAMKNTSNTYQDPATGFTVFTQLFHLKRGTCCGNACRHCPYGWEQVNESKKQHAQTNTPSPLLQSGDYETADSILSQYGVVVKRNEKRQAKLKQKQQEVKSDNNESTNVIPTARAASFVSDNQKDKQKEDNLNKDMINKIGVSVTTVESPSLSLPATTQASQDNQNSTYSTSSPISCMKNVPFTKTGDKGTSQLLTGERRSKDDCNFEALGTVDELCSVVGVVYSQLNDKIEYNNENIDLQSQLLNVMSRLFDVGSHIAKPKLSNKNNNNASPSSLFIPNGIGDGFDPMHVNLLETWIEQMTNEMPELTSFILPTGAPAAAQLHVARTVCRRAERRIVPLVFGQQNEQQEDENESNQFQPTADPNVLQYINRLSDYFFTAARWVNYCEGRDEILYQRSTISDTQRQMVTRNLAKQQK